jgi:hypothetical protein
VCDGSLVAKLRDSTRAREGKSRLAMDELRDQGDGTRQRMGFMIPTSRTFGLGDASIGLGFRPHKDDTTRIDTILNSSVEGCQEARKWRRLGLSWETGTWVLDLQQAIMGFFFFFFKDIIA